MRGQVPSRSISVLAVVAMSATLVLLPIRAGATATRSPLWTATFTSTRAVGTAVAVDPSDSTVYVGGSTQARPRRFLVAAYVADTGQRRWVATYPCSDVATKGCWLYPDSLAVSPDGTTVFFTGSARRADGVRDLVTMAVDSSTGAERWVARSANFNEVTAPRMAMSPKGDRIFVAGPVGPIDAPARWGERVLAYDATTGGLLWRTRIAGCASFPQTLIGVSPDGVRIFLSLTDEGAGQRVKTLALDAGTGETSWVRWFGLSSAHNEASDLAVDPSGRRVYVADYRWGSMPGGEGEMIRWPVTLAYGAAHGRSLWKTVVQGAISDCQHIAIAASRAQVFVTNGYAVGSLRAETGHLQWVRVTATLPGMWSDFDFKLAVSPDGAHVFASEALTDAYSDSRVRLETVAVNTATGRLRWTAVRRGLPWGELAVGPSGARVYVASTLLYPGGVFRGMLAVAYHA